MNFKKVLGYLLKVVAIFIGLAFLVGIVDLLGSIVTIFKVIFGNSNSYDLGYAVGNLIANAFFIVIIYFLWKFGSKLIKASN